MLERVILSAFLILSLGAGPLCAFESAQSSGMIREMMGRVGQGPAVFRAKAVRVSRSYSNNAGLQAILGGSRVSSLSNVGGPSAPRLNRPSLDAYSTRPTAVPSAAPAVHKKRAAKRLSPHGPAPRLKAKSLSANRARSTKKDNSDDHTFLLDRLLRAPLVGPDRLAYALSRPRIKAKAIYCMDCSSNKVLLAENIDEALPIASITKLLTAMTVIDNMKLHRVVDVPKAVLKVEPKKVGLVPGDMLSIKDLLHGMLIESGNDCAEVLARSYADGGRTPFMVAMNRKARSIGAKKARFYTPSGLDYPVKIGKLDDRPLITKKRNAASAEGVALIARYAFSHYPLIREISSTKRYTMRARNKKKRRYRLRSNDRLLFRPLPVAGAKTGFTNAAGRCIVAQFKDNDRNYMVVVLNTPRHFSAAEKIYKWACETF